MSRANLNVRETIRFYDDDPDAGVHSNAIKTLAGEELGLALLAHFFKEGGREPALIPAPCAGDGARLDGWISVAQPEPVLYQVEVKSWSMHGFRSGHRRLALDATPKEIEEYKSRIWEEDYWKDGTFKEDRLRKVLTPMRRPKKPPTPPSIKPVACLWAAVHPTGKTEPFFEVPTVAPDFGNVVHIFSMSAYLRNLAGAGKTTVLIELPKTKARIQYLSNLFDFRAPPEPDV
jgi:hypothetical protein